MDYISVPVIPELLRAKVSVFAELHRKAQQLQALNRELEQRVAERTQELGKKAEALELLNMQLNRKNDRLDAILQTAPDIIFSSRGDGSRDFISARFFEYTGATPNRPMGFGWMDYVHPDDQARSMAHWVQCASDPREIMKPSTGSGTRQETIVGFALVRSRFAIEGTKSSDGTAPVPIFTTASCWNNRFAKMRPHSKR